jgi:hypothetical protein
MSDHAHIARADDAGALRASRARRRRRGSCARSAQRQAAAAGRVCARAHACAVTLVVCGCAGCGAVATRVLAAVVQPTRATSARDGRRVSPIAGADRRLARSAPLVAGA